MKLGLVRRSLIVLLVLLPAYSVCVYAQCQQSSPLPELAYQIVNTYPHNANSFTQGLFVEQDLVYESTGLKGQSYVHVYHYKTGKPFKSIKLADHLFGEGLAAVGEKLVQLTYKAGKGLVYDKATLQKLSEFSYPVEGWGLAYDGEHLILSNGSATLFYLHAESYRLLKKIEVFSEGSPLKYLNELEVINGKIFANIWQDDRIAVIDFKTGCNTAWLNLSELRKQLEKEQRLNVLNGIAYIKDNGHLLVTGKWWPRLFEIKLVDSVLSN